ncbi:hypothetical protein LSTR_LSTR003584 [Laodelphax striatellus]|uniref:Short/branched chain specific acyl-CoA dehydrogenase, mitochondrial n=1 Tax=Laodelphax striatellus TaxID=195883 RepID=A0A482WKX9_LAOST|nr:hypothetical protein LSTR_LSTR003584 [Laodelphax striatellus]
MMTFLSLNSLVTILIKQNHVFRLKVRRPTQTFLRAALKRQFSGTPLVEAPSSIHAPPLTIFSEDEALLKETANKFAKEMVAPLVKKMEQEKKIDDGLLKALFDNGFMGLEIDTKYGGAGSSFFSSILIIEEISKVDPALSIIVDIQNTLVNAMIAKLGTEEQKDKYLPRLATDMASSFALSETQSGSDAFALRTKAVKDGSDYIINGSKMWISNSDVAGLFLVMVNADVSKGYRGITCFIVERDTPGLSIGKKEDKLGMKCSGTCTVNFDNVRVPESNILGEFGSGYRYAAGFLNQGRIGIAAQMVGLAQGCFDATIPYTLQREQFGDKIFSFQAVQHQLSNIATEIECARLLTYNAARLLEGGHPFIKEASMAKYFASNAAVRTTAACIDLMGGVGFTTDFPQEKFYRDCKVGSIYEGTTNMQLNTIAKYLKKEYEE